MPEFVFPPESAAELARYCRETGDSLSYILRCGADPQHIHSDRAMFEIYAAYEALRDPQVTPSMEVSAIQVAVVLSEFNHDDSALELLNSLDENLEKIRTEGPLSLTPEEDPRFFGGVLLMDLGRYGASRAQEAIAWFQKSLLRPPDDLEFRGYVHAAIALAHHRLRDFSIAVQQYGEAIAAFEVDLERQIAESNVSDDPNDYFVDAFTEQLDLLRTAKSRSEKGLDSNLQISGRGLVIK